MNVGECNPACNNARNAKSLGDAVTPRGMANKEVALMAAKKSTPPGIYPTPNGTYIVKYREGGKQRSKTLETLEEAVTFQSHAKRRRSEGKPIVRRQDAPTLEEFTKQWLAKRTDLAEATMVRYVAALTAHVLPQLGHLSLVELRPRRLAEWQEERLADGAGPSALGKAQKVLSQILNTAVLPYEYLDSNPALHLKQPIYERRPHRWLTAEDVEKLRSWYLERDDLGSATLISVLAYVGLRPQDALARTWAELGERLTVVTKNSNGKIYDGSKTGRGYERTVYVPDLVRADLEEWRLASKGVNLIFPRRDGKPWTKIDYDNWSSRPPRGKKGKRPRCFRAAAEDSDLGNLTPYALRHTAASLMAASGWTAVEIATQLGHSPTESQRTYQHILVVKGQGQRQTIDGYIAQARELVPAELDAGRVVAQG